MSTMPLDMNGSNNGTVTITVNTSDHVAAAGDNSDSETSRQLVAMLLFASGFCTLRMDVATALYKARQGVVVFQRHRLAY